jgi:hypothetical protein
MLRLIVTPESIVALWDTGRSTAVAGRPPVVVIPEAEPKVQDQSLSPGGGLASVLHF